MREVVLIAGPPGSGKTTRARALAEQRGLVIYDRDDDKWSGERSFVGALIALGIDPDARAVVIRSCATRTAWLAAVEMVKPTATELLATPASTCRQRIAHDPRAYTGHTWASPQRRLAGVRTWWADHDADPWSPPRETLGASKRWSTASF